jgi:hypothetical protein
MQVVDVRTRSRAAKATFWDGTTEQGAEICEWINALGEVRAEVDEIGVLGGPEHPVHIRLSRLTPDCGGEISATFLYPQRWVVQEGHEHRHVTAEEYGELYVEVDDRTAALCVVAGWVVGDQPDEVKGVIDLDLKSCDTLSQAIGIAIGAASMTWPEVHGVFDEVKARDIWAQLEHDVVRRLIPAKPEVAVDDSRPAPGVACGATTDAEPYRGPDHAGETLTCIKTSPAHSSHKSIDGAMWPNLAGRKGEGACAGGC